MDIRLLIKKISGSLDKNEQSAFDQWYHASARHRAYYHKLKSNFQKEDGLVVDTSNAWKSINTRIESSAISHWKYFIAAVFLIAAISLPFYEMVIKSTESEINVVDTQPEIIDEVIFEDPDGNSIVLEEEDSLKTDYYNVDRKKLKISNDNTKKGFNVITVPHGKQFSVELSDGTLVYLNALSKFKFPSNFKSEQNRIVELIYGEAFFDVSSAKENNNKRFIVKNQNQNIEVVGTSFNIESYDKNKVVTTLIEGAINLRIKDVKVQMLPGQQSQVIASSLKSVEYVNVQDFIAWKEGMFVFKEESLKEIFKVLSRWYDVDVEFETKHLEQIKFNGRFKNELELDRIIELIENTKRARFELNGNNVKVMPY